MYWRGYSFIRFFVWHVAVNVENVFVELEPYSYVGRILSPCIVPSAE